MHVQIDNINCTAAQGSHNAFCSTVVIHSRCAQCTAHWYLRWCACCQSRAYVVLGRRKLLLAGFRYMVACGADASCAAAAINCSSKEDLATCMVSCHMQLWCLCAMTGHGEWKCQLGHNYFP